MYRKWPVNGPLYYILTIIKVLLLLDMTQHYYRPSCSSLVKLVQLNMYQLMASWNYS